jgi:ribosome biogenesis GTPase
VPGRSATSASGTVLQFEGGIYDVELADGSIVRASLRGRLKLEQRTGDRVVAGDEVAVESHDDGSVTIEEVQPRSTELARRAPGRGARRAKDIVANVDQVVVVLAAATPDPRPTILDRFLLLAESSDLPALIVLNKTDLGDEEAARTLLAPYRAAGYATLTTSVKAERGIDAFRDALCGRKSVLTGPSGVGKSSLLNAVEPGLGLRIAAVAAIGKGRHTTVTARLIPLQCGGHVADTPGLREVGLWDVDPRDLDRLYPEFEPWLDQCRFGSDCTHTHEPRCAVREAAENGAIARPRYDSYVSLMEESKQKE